MFHWQCKSDILNTVILGLHIMTEWTWCFSLCFPLSFAYVAQKHCLSFWNSNTQSVWNTTCIHHTESKILPALKWEQPVTVQKSVVFSVIERFVLSSVFWVKLCPSTHCLLHFSNPVHSFLLHISLISVRRDCRLIQQIHDYVLSVFFCAPEIAIGTAEIIWIGTYPPPPFCVTDYWLAMHIDYVLVCA